MIGRALVLGLWLLGHPASAEMTGHCGCGTATDCTSGRICTTQGFCWVTEGEPGAYTCASDTDCAPGFRCGRLRVDWPPVQLRAEPGACLAQTLEAYYPDAGPTLRAIVRALETWVCAIQNTWTEPKTNPLPPTEVAAEPTGCDTVHVTFAPDWPYPTTTRVYVGGAYVGEHADDRTEFELQGVARGETTVELDAYSTTYGVAYASGKTAPVTADTRQVCPLPGDCAIPYDDQYTLFDVLAAVDVVLGVRTPVAGGCDADCDGAVGLFDVLRDIDVVLGAQGPPLCGAAVPADAT